jgi:hypothetical protein
MRATAAGVGRGSEVAAYPVFHGVNPSVGLGGGGGPAAVFSGEEAGGVVVGVASAEWEFVADVMLGPPGGGGDYDDVSGFLDRDG